MNTLRILCFGDNHGDQNSLQQVVSETEGETFDYIIHVGDITNACEEGLEAGADQLQQLKPLFAELSERGELVYVWGNRDFEICTKGVGTRIDRFSDFPFDEGTHIPRTGTIDVAGQRFTQDPDAVDSETILVTHYYHPELLDHFEGRAYFSGHVHTGRRKGNVLNTGFLYRGGEHGATPLQGGYFIVELDSDRMDVSFHSLGGLEEGSCPDHLARGFQYTPRNWQSNCTFCYEEEPFYTEILESTQLALERTEREVTQTNLYETAIDLYQHTGVPDDFESTLSSYVEEFL
jgi:predicted phosphodiesterase